MLKLKTLYEWFYLRILEGSFVFIYGLLRLLSPERFRRFCQPVIQLLVYFLLPKKRIVRNLAAAFGERYSLATKKGMAKGVQEHFTRNLLDCLLQLSHPEHARETIEIRGIGNLEAALAKGKGVIALGAHIGNFVLLGTRLGLEGFQFSTLFRIPSEQRINGIIHQYLPYFHQRIIPSRPKRLAVVQILATLKRNEIVFILADNLKRGRIQTLLFGQPVPSPRGPVSLALRSQAAVVPMYLVRSYTGGLHLVIEPEIELTRSGDLSVDIAQNTHQIVRYLENLIRLYPDQWNWLTVRMRKNTPVADSPLSNP